MGKNNMKKGCEIIAEIANAHQGNPNTALKLALEAHKVGADAVKFQIYFADELLANNHPRFNHFKKQSFSKSNWVKIIKTLKKKKIKIYCDIFGEKAFKIGEFCNVDGYKIHSSDLNNDIILNLVKKTNKKIFLSAGGSTIEEIAYAAQILNNSKKTPVIMHGFQSYPTKIENSDLFKINSYREIFGKLCELGYQDHISGEDPLNYTTSLVALGKGATYFEKHITFDRSKKGVDYYSSLEPQELKNFINLIRNTEKSLGNNNFEEVSSDEKKYRDTVKKVWFLKKSVKKGHIIKKKDLIMKRPAKLFTNNPQFSDIINKKTIIDIDKNIEINRSMFNNFVTGVIVVRTESKRLKKKALKKICGYYTIEHLIERAKKSKLINQIILCTTLEKNDDILEKIALKNKILCYRGSNKDVLKRMLDGIKHNHNKSEIVVRITGDDILIDPNYLDLTIQHHLINNLQYTDAKKLPSGIDAEIFNTRLLKLIYKISKDTSGTEYLTYYINDHRKQFSTGALKVSSKYKNKIRLTLDNKNDFIVIKTFLEQMSKNKKLFNYNFQDLISFYNKNRKLFKVNISSKTKKVDINTDFDWKKII